MERALKELFFYLPRSILDETHKLSNGNIFPMISFETGYTDSLENVIKSIDTALKVGYRSFDIYPCRRNEEEVGHALEELLPKHNLTREDIYLTIKILPEFYGKDIARHSVLTSLRNLRTYYIDVCLLQWPGGANMEPECIDNVTLRGESWNELIALYKEGIIKNAGVSNFTSKQLMSLMASSYDIKPVINQVEFHPRFQQKELLITAKEYNILLQATCLKDCFHIRVLTDPVVLSVAKSIRKTPTQVILKWILNYGVAVIVQAEKPDCIRDNYLLFDFLLERPEMEALNNIQIREKYQPNSVCII